MMQWKSERAPADAWEWLVDALAEELAAMPDADARHILARLDDRAGYPLESELAAMFPVVNGRRRLVDRLMARAGRGPAGRLNPRLSNSESGLDQLQRRRSGAASC